MARTPQRPRRIYLFRELKDRGVPFSRKHIATLERRGDFPDRVQLGENTVGWPADKVDRWVEDRVRRPSNFKQGRHTRPPPPPRFATTGATQAQTVAGAVTEADAENAARRRRVCSRKTRSGAKGG